LFGGAPSTARPCLGWPKGFPQESAQPL
jgi:hypothetical protein